MGRPSAVLAASILVILLAPGAVSAKPKTATVLDTLGAATPQTVFGVFGSSGVSILPSVSVGAEFVLSERTFVTEIGGFVNNCVAIVEGLAQCPDTRPFLLQVRPSTNGLPDPVTVLATFVLSHDDDPYHTSYESVRMNLKLPAGRYFAMFVAQGSDAGYLLGGASTPFSYLADSLREGAVNLQTGAVSASQEYAAVRVLARK